ncbi:MAG: hypothetical protein QOE08_1780 [Thermoleophilaceae bacterium]|nr:hypothetical protein [Thermoleophilaceae bacterium]
MRGLTIIGAGSEAGELAVARAACDVLRELGSNPSLYEPGLDETTDAGALLEGARGAATGDVLVTVLGGGLLAPVTPRLSVRDLAAQLGAPVVLALAGGPDAANVARLSIESARAARLAVKALVVQEGDAGAQLDGLVDVPVETLPANPTAATGWPVERWLETAGAEAPAGASASNAVVLEPYGQWEATPVGDPRDTPRPQLMQALAEIVAAEGPMTATRAYALCNRAAGGRKLTNAVRTPLSSALYWLAREGKVSITREEDAPWQGDDLVRSPDAPEVRVRELGPRTLEEVPLEEIAELMRRLAAARGLRGATDLKRAVLSAYGLVRLTARADEYLGLAVELATE